MSVAEVTASIEDASVTSAALVIVGILMFVQIREIEWDDMAVVASVFMTILMMVLTILLPAAGALALKLIPGLNADRKRLYLVTGCALLADCVLAAITALCGDAESADEELPVDFLSKGIEKQRHDFLIAVGPVPEFEAASDVTGVKPAVEVDRDRTVVEWTFLEAFRIKADPEGKPACRQILREEVCGKQIYHFGKDQLSLVVCIGS